MITNWFPSFVLAVVTVCSRSWTLVLGQMRAAVISLDIWSVQNLALVVDFSNCCVQVCVQQLWMLHCIVHRLPTDHELHRPWKTSIVGCSFRPCAANKSWKVFLVSFLLRVLLSVGFCLCGGLLRLCILDPWVSTICTLAVYWLWRGTWPCTSAFSVSVR